MSSMMGNVKNYYSHSIPSNHNNCGQYKIFTIDGTEKINRT